LSGLVILYCKVVLTLWVEGHMSRICWLNVAYARYEKFFIGEMKALDALYITWHITFTSYWNLIYRFL